jgi:hypothetical protein
VTPEDGREEGTFPDGNGKEMGWLERRRVVDASEKGKRLQGVWGREKTEDINVLLDRKAEKERWKARNQKEKEIREERKERKEKKTKRRKKKK